MIGARRIVVVTAAFMVIFFLKKKFVNFFTLGKLSVLEKVPMCEKDFFKKLVFFS